MNKDSKLTSDHIPVHWNTFLDTSPEETNLNSAGIIVIPIPYDGTTSYRSGARHGPKAIIEASRHLEDYDIELDRDISQVGIYTLPEIEPDMRGPEFMMDRVCDSVTHTVKQGKLAAILGGEHSITIGAVRAIAKTCNDISVLYFDAHADLRDSYMGTRWGHASAARRISELCPIVEVGVRSLSYDERLFAKDENLPIIYWPPSENNLSTLTATILDSLSSKVYVSVDVDVFDPSLMSAVGTPEPGGMTWTETIELIKIISTQRDIIGFDITELSPSQGPESCAFTAAKLAYKLMGYATDCQTSTGSLII